MLLLGFYIKSFQISNPKNIPVVMYGIAGYAFPFLVMKNRNDNPASAPKITKSAGMIPNACMKTPAVIIGKMTSPPPRIARLTLNFFFLILAGIFLPLYFCFIFAI